ncbi:MAG: methionyl-tRNA formyltransferase [Pseudomonadota bacterium]
MKLPRIVFAGTPDFAVPSLEALLRAGLPVVGVITQPDRRSGRGRRLTAPPVKQCAEAHQVPVLQPARLSQELAPLVALEPDVLVVVAYGQLLSQAVLDIPTCETLNVHASLLPRWRGAAPIQRAIEAGDASTGVAIMRVVLELDAGPVYRMGETPIDPRDTTASVHDRLANMGGALLLETIESLDKAQPTAQDPSLVTYASRLQKSEAQVDWSASAQEIERRIRAFNPRPICDTGLEGEVDRIRLWEAQLSPVANSDSPAGTVLAANAKGIDVQTGAGVLRLTRLQSPGRKPLGAGEFLQGRALLDRRLT